MSERERSTGKDLRLLAESALLPLGTGLTLLDGWLIGGVAGVLMAAFFGVALFLGLWFGLRQSEPVTNKKILTLAVCVSLTLIVFLTKI